MGSQVSSEDAASQAVAASPPAPPPPPPAARPSERPPLAPARPLKQATVESQTGTSSLTEFERNVSQGRLKVATMLLVGNCYPLRDHRFLHDYLRGSEEVTEQGSEVSEEAMFERNPGITWKHFLITIDWLSIVQIQFSLKPEVLFLTVSLMVRVLKKSGRPITLGKLQCLGVSAMRVACKFEETTTLRVLDFSKITDRSSSCQDILGFEHLVLETIGFQISRPTVFPFLCWYTEGLTTPQRKKAFFWAEAALLSSAVMATFRPSSIAAAATCIGLDKNWSDAMAKLCDYRYEELVPTMTAMVEFVDKIKARKYFIFHKYGLN